MRFFKNRQLGLRPKIILWAFVPTAIILIAVAAVNYLAYRKVAETLIVERDEEVTRLAASQIATSLAEYADLLDSEVRNAALAQGDVIYQQAALTRARNRLAIFDGGVVYSTVPVKWWRLSQRDPTFWGIIGHSAPTFVRYCVRRVRSFPTRWMMGHRVAPSLLLRFLSLVNRKS